MGFGAKTTFKEEFYRFHLVVYQSGCFLDSAPRVCFHTYVLVFREYGCQKLKKVSSLQVDQKCHLVSE